MKTIVRISQCLSFRAKRRNRFFVPDKDSGFTLIELLIVMSIMLILMAFAVPQMLKLKKHANQIRPFRPCAPSIRPRLIYNSAYPGTGYACPLAALGGDPKAGAAFRNICPVIDPQLATSGQKSGYTFTVTCGTKVTINNQDMYTSYTLTAVPQTVGKTGDNVATAPTRTTSSRSILPAATNCTQSIQ